MTCLSRALLLGALLATASPVAVLATETPAAPADTTASPPAVSGIIVTAASSEAHDKLAPSTTETVTAQDVSDTVNAVNIEDALKYLPDVFIRKRHIGDTQAPMATRTSGVGASARSLIYVDGMLISALIGNNNTNASPRWGMAPEQAVSRIDMLYGPFSAAYPGNSIGGVIEITTRMPDHFEGEAKVVGSLQDFSLYHTHDQYGAGQGSLLLGDRWGALAARLSWQHTESNSQPLSLVNGTQGGGVTGGVADVNRTNQPILVVGASGLEHQIQDNQTLKLAYDLSPAVQLAYTLGRFTNDTAAHAQSYQVNGAGAPVFTSAYSSGIYRLDEAHWMNGLSAKVDTDRFNGRLSASVYDYSTDVQRTPSTTAPPSLTGGSGFITRLDGTGWTTLDADGVFRPSGRDGAHAIAFGLHYDRFNLDSQKFNTSDWIHGPEGSLATASRGDTETQSAYVQDVWAIDPNLKLTAGLRAEHWQAKKGFNYSLSPALSANQPELSATRTSPKASLEWMPSGGHWRLTASYGEAYRFPTVTELYQAVTTGAVLTVPNPNLKPEHARSTELAAEWSDEKSRVRLSLFNEDIHNALISQSAPLVAGSATLFNYVQNIDRTIATGAEAVFERKDLWIKGLDLTASVTYLDPHISSDPVFAAAVGKQIPQVPKWRSTVVATWRPTDRWTFSAGGRYSSRLYGTIDNSDVVGHTYQGFEGYLVVDARASYKVNDHWQAALGVDNAGDRSYFLFHPFPQRTVTAELTYKF